MTGGGCLAAIDFQPLSTSPEYFSSELYQPYEEELQQWQQKLPDGGELPTAAKRFFSPLRLWTRMSVKDDEYSMNLKNLNEALDNYTRCYLRIVSEAKAENALSTTTINERKIAIADYLKYRVENDPASGLLNSAYGKEWTETVLREVVFPASYPVSATKL